MGHAGQPIDDISRQTWQQLPDASAATASAAAVAVAGVAAGGGDGGDVDADGVAISRNGCTIVPATTHAASSSSSSSSSSSATSSTSDGLPQSSAPSPVLSPLAMLRNSWRWGHLCPTAPDTLPCYPYTEKGKHNSYTYLRPCTCSPLHISRLLLVPCFAFLALPSSPALLLLYIHFPHAFPSLMPCTSF